MCLSSPWAADSRCSRCSRPLIHCREVGIAWQCGVRQLDDPLCTHSIIRYCVCPSDQRITRPESLMNPRANVFSDTPTPPSIRNHLNPSSSTRVVSQVRLVNYHHLATWFSLDSPALLQFTVSGPDLRDGRASCVPAECKLCQTTGSQARPPFETSHARGWRAERPRGKSPQQATSHCCLSTVSASQGTPFRLEIGHGLALGGAVDAELEKKC